MIFQLKKNSFMMTWMYKLVTSQIIFRSVSRFGAWNNSDGVLLNDWRMKTTFLILVF